MWRAPADRSPPEEGADHRAGLRDPTQPLPDAGCAALGISDLLGARRAQPGGGRVHDVAPREQDQGPDRPYPARPAHVRVERGRLRCRLVADGLLAGAHAADQRPPLLHGAAGRRPDHRHARRQGPGVPAAPGGARAAGQHGIPEHVLLVLLLHQRHARLWPHAADGRPAQHGVPAALRHAAAADGLGAEPRGPRAGLAALVG
mmetsp:Transcript_79467/g.243127  ORF Transcript_79467/g.243127 Transcript_79467/m.243127 type:complete len:203 (-) Transcript_79467:718-1326(-)